MSSINNSSVDRLFQVILGLESVEECYEFFSDICTVKELLDMAQRLDTAVLLDKGVSYQNISKEIGISAATIGRVSRCLQYGSGGYRRQLDKLASDEEKENGIQ